MPPVTIVERVLPDASPILEAMARLKGEIHVGAPGIVDSFDATTMTCVVYPAISELIRIDGVLQSVTLYALQDVPVVIPRAGGMSLTLPIMQGDECALLFADGCIDAWHQNGGVQARISADRHALGDVFAIFGLSSVPRVLANYSTTSMQLRTDDGQTVIDLRSGQIVVSGTTVTVNAETANVTASHNANVTASQKVEINGAQGVDVVGAGLVKIDGHSFLNHTHTGGTGPGGLTGPVNPAGA